MACAELARTTFAASKSLGMLKRNIQMLELTALGRVFLMPAGTAWEGVLKGTDVYLFLVGMMLMSEVARKEGLFDWLAGSPDTGGHGMHLAFTDVQRGRAPYLPHMVLGPRPPDLVTRLRQLPLRRQYEIAELLIGNIITHSLYVTRDAACTAPYGDPASIPFYFHEPITGEIMAQVFGASRMG